MVLTVTGYGAALKKQGNCIVVEYSDKTHQRFPIFQIESVFLTAACAMTSDFITLCTDHDIPITMVNAYGKPVWRTEAFQGGSVPSLRRKQMLLSECPEGITFIRAILDKKLSAQRAFLKKLASNRRNDCGKDLLAQADKIKEIRAHVHSLKGDTVRSIRPKLLGLEGTAGRLYFSALKKILPDHAGFYVRGRGEQAGPFNQMLNYGYGLLYQEVLYSCQRDKRGGSGLFWLIMYDITNQKRLQQTVRLCRSFGLHRIQKSVYLGRFGQDIAMQLRERLIECVNFESDRAIMLQFTKKQMAGCINLCKNPNLIEILEPKDVVFV